MRRETKPRLSDLAYAGLRSAIIRAEMRPGSPIDERQCMEMLDVGRTPLREALQRLAQEELVTAVPQKGYFVSSTSAEDFFHLNEFRIHSEALAARMAAVRISQEQLQGFQDLLERAEEGVAQRRTDIDWHLSIDEAMHRIIYEASGNPYLRETLGRLYALSVRSLYISRVPITLIFDEIDNFHALHTSLKQRDPDAAEKAMRAHLNFGSLPASASGFMRPVASSSVQS